MDSVNAIAIVSIAAAALCMAIGSIGPALGEGKAISQALSSSRNNPMRREPLAGLCSSAWR